MQVVPRAMFNLVTEVISLNKRSRVTQGGGGTPPADFIYNLIPDADRVLDRSVVTLYGNCL